jgi:hypothetical protein
MEHGGVWSLSGYRVITVDGQVVVRDGKFWDTGSEHRFEVEGIPCILRIRHQVFGYEYELWVDGKPMPDPANPADKDPTPASAWIELVAMSLCLLGGVLIVFGDKGRFLDNRKPGEDRIARPEKGRIPQYGILEYAHKTMSPAMQVGWVVVAAVLVLGIVSIIMRFSRKRARANPGKVTDRSGGSAGGAKLSAKRGRRRPSCFSPTAAHFAFPSCVAQRGQRLCPQRGRRC